MIEIKLLAVPNQSISITIDGIVFGIVLKTTSITVADIYIDEVLKIAGVKCRPNLAIVPYEYLINGNFYFVVEGEELPDYTKFGISQSLVYLTKAEIDAL